MLKPCEILVGRTYKNRGAGRSLRRVVEISDAQRPADWLGKGPAPAEPGVLYEQMGVRGRRDKLYLSSFATWAGGEVVD